MGVNKYKEMCESMEKSKVTVTSKKNTGIGRNRIDAEKKIIFS